MRFRWRAYYGDSHVDEGKVQYSKLERSGLTAFSLRCGKHEIVLYVQPSEKLFYRMRTVWKPFAVPSETVRMWLMGVQRKLNGQIVRRIVFVGEDGFVEVFSDFQNVEPYMCPQFSVEENV